MIFTLPFPLIISFRDVFVHLQTENKAPCPGERATTGDEGSVALRLPLSVIECYRFFDFDPAGALAGGDK